MAEQENSQNKLKSQAEQINLALDSVLSEDQAKELINGRIEDAFVMKAKVDIDNRSGVVMILFSTYKKKILELYSLIGNSPILRKIRTFEDYQQLSLDFVEVTNAGGIDTALSEIVGQAIYSMYNTDVIGSFLPFWEKKDTTNSILMMEQNVQKKVKATRVKIAAEVDKVSSVKFRYKNIMIGTVAPIKPPIEDEAFNSSEEGLPEGELDGEEMAPYERLIDNVAKRYSRMLECETMLSPVAGVEFDDLVEGQEILFRLPYQTSQEKATAQALELVDSEGKLKPLIGKFISIVYGDDSYHILAEGPSNTVIRSIEERPVRVATPKKLVKELDLNANEPLNSNAGLLIIGAVVAFCILIAILVIL
ncbi:hypothetical protein [Leptospira sp. GIMC2001]|uniref:hypothetical protein n=1 Tax=Leptospira sp. GIMC2001 TaxID=1513297 RepID=UPI00234BB7F5|nr:hypothetical protein [Leptospira sp. GIMC2001]WCL49316.1 hypothetical protein O4O04_18810 [Leptospira sp. GIMC2001]